MLLDEMRGRWRGILPEFGINPNHLTGKHVPCPVCGGKDRFRFDDKDGRGTWICTHCGAGSASRLIMMVNPSMQWNDVKERLQRVVGSVKREKPKPKPDQEWARRVKNEIWTKADAVTMDSAAGRYLTRRCGIKQYPSALRYNLSVRYAAGKMFPAMVAMVTAPGGKPATLHQTFLTPEGHKAPVEPVRKLAPGYVAPGSAVRLSDPGAIMGVAEGIETALSAAQLFGLPVWAALNTSLLKMWKPPDEAREVLVFADNDENLQGQIAAFLLGQKLLRAGLKVRVELPPTLGQDWNDVLTRGAKK